MEHLKKSPLQGKPTWERIRTSGDWPKLKAKAANTRYLVRYACHLAEKHNDSSLHDRRRLACCQYLKHVYDVVSGDDRWFSPAQQEGLKVGVRNFVSCYAHLSREALSSIPPKRAWKMVPKFHAFVHLVEIQIPLWSNPRFF